MITKFKLFENAKDRYRYFAFDWDDNILNMPTVIHMDHLVNNEWIPEDVSTSEFAIVRSKLDWRPRNNNHRDAYCEFRHFGPRGEMSFVLDAMKALKEHSYGPSWKTFIDCLVGGNLFAIITSRGHEPKIIRTVVEWIIYNVLTDEQQDEMLQNLLRYHEIFGEDVDYLVDQYLDNCEFIGIESEYFKNKLHTSVAESSPEHCKEVAIKYFKDKMGKFMEQIGGKMSIGFSDDDPKFASHIEEYMRKEKSLDPITDYYVHKTTDPKNIIRTKI